MSTLLERCIESLSVIANTATGLAHSLDESRAKELFIALHKEGVSLDFATVKSLALANDWTERHAVELANLAVKIGNGSRVIVKHPRDWGEWIVSKHKTEIASQNS